MVWNLLRETWNAWTRRRAPRMAAALAFYAIFAIGPILVIAISVTGLILNDAVSAREGITNQMSELIGPHGADAVKALIEGADQRGAGVLATIIGIVTLLVASGGFFAELQDALNAVWEVQPKPGRGIWGAIRSRFLSFSMVLGVGFLLLVSLVISAALSGFVTLLAGDESGPFWGLVNFVLSFSLTTLLFAAIFKILPDVKLSWSDVWIGATATSLLFTIGKSLIGLYLGSAAPESTYGVAGSLIAVLIWVYYSAQILLLGAEFTQVYAHRFGSRIEPTEGAEFITERAAAERVLASQTHL